MSLPKLPTVGGSILRAIFTFAVAAFLYSMAEKVNTVNVTLISGGTVQSQAVPEDDDRYLEERDRARTKAMPYYVGAGIFALIGVGYVRKAMRIQRKTRILDHTLPSDRR